MPHIARFLDSIQNWEIDAVEVENFVQHFTAAVFNVCKINEDNSLNSEPSHNNTIEDKFKFSSHLSVSLFLTLRTF